jgi:hypothetical protein
MQWWSILGGWRVLTILISKKLIKKYSICIQVEEDRHPCGAHEIGDAIPGSDFDYTCDDCMLPEPHLDPPEME